METEKKKLISSKAFADEYGVGIAQVYTSANKGELPTCRFGRRLWIVRGLDQKLHGSVEHCHRTTTARQLRHGKATVSTKAGRLIELLRKHNILKSAFITRGFLF